MGSGNSGIRYRKPPLQEAICEFYYDAQERVTPENIETLREVWRRQGFENQNIVDQKNVDVRLSIQGLETRETKTGNKLVCRTKDGIQLVQLTEKLLAVNHLAPYPGWDKVFRPRVLKRLEEFRNTVPLKGIKRVGLRYIDRIDVPQDPLKWSDWFNLELPVPAALKRAGSRLQLRLESDLEEDLRAVTQIFSAPPQKPDHSSVVFDMDVISSRYLSIEGVASELERVHRPQTLAFEEILTDNLRKLFDPQQ